MRLDGTLLVWLALVCTACSGGGGGGQDASDGDNGGDGRDLPIFIETFPMPDQGSPDPGQDLYDPGDAGDPGSGDDGMVDVHEVIGDPGTEAEVRPECVTDQDCEALYPELDTCRWIVCLTDQGVCSIRFLSEGNPCDDGNPCTVGDVCSDEGDCIPGENDCQCESDEDCASLDDDNLCNGILVCDLAQAPWLCVVDPGSVVVCQDLEDPCLANQCDPATGECAAEPVNQGEDCDDGEPCTTGSTCTDGECTGGTPRICDDGNDCTADSCEPEVGCVFVPREGSCNDGNACTLDDMCDQGTCVGGGPRICNDDNPCTDDECLPSFGCVFRDNSASCDDGDPCTVGDACQEGTCFPGLPRDCSDGDACNGLETCEAGVGCVPGTPVDCDDGNVCTADICDPATGECSNPPVDGGDCDDGDVCTTDDRCLGGACFGDEACCQDGMDNSGNGLTDCDDRACGIDPACEADVEWCRLQGPAAIEAVAGTVYGVTGRVRALGLTDLSPGVDTAAALVAQAGYGPLGTMPAAGDWTWFEASPTAGWDGTAAGEPQNDEYTLLMTVPAPDPALRNYAFRFSGDGGRTWLYCDLDKGEGADGSQDGYSSDDAGTMGIRDMNLYLSEYVAGSGSHKALEVYNASVTSFPLGELRIDQFMNGSPSATYSIFLQSAAGDPRFPNGLLPPGGVFVLCNSDVLNDADFQARCDQKHINVLFDGDDAILLRWVPPGAPFMTLDAFGRLGERPSPAWGSGDVTTRDRTLRRKCSVTYGDRNPGDSFNPATEWDAFPLDTFDGLGSHCR